MLRIKDLPPSPHGRQHPDGSYTEPRRPVLYCPRCHAEYSANPADYFMASPNAPLRCACTGPGRFSPALVLGMPYEGIDIIAR